MHFAAAYEETNETGQRLHEIVTQNLIGTAEDINYDVIIIHSILQDEEDHIDELQKELDDDYYNGAQTGNRIHHRINAQDNDGRTALHFAAQHGNLEIVKMLLNKGSNPNIQDNQGMTPLHEGVGSASVELVQKILKSRARVDMKDMNGLTALHYSSLLGADEIFDALISHGANFNLLDNQCRTALNLAFMHGHANIVLKLMKMGSTFNYPTTYWSRYTLWKKDILNDLGTTNA